MVPTNFKVVGLTDPAAIVDNAAFTTKVLDTLGFRFAQIFVWFGAMDVALSALRVQESEATSDANTLSGPTDVPGTVVGTDVNDTGSASTLPAATADNTFFKFEIDLRGRKRYLDVAMTGGDGAAGTFAVVFAVLHRGEISPTTPAQKGVAQVMRVPAL